MATIRGLHSVRRSFSCYFLNSSQKQIRLSYATANKGDTESNKSEQSLPNAVAMSDKADHKFEPKETTSFATLLRKSSLMMLGPLKEAKLRGKIMEVVEDDLYIDFGGKFYCVCPRPKPKGEYYRGREVQILLHDWEMASKFIGSERYVTLLEADATLVGLWRPPVKEEESADEKDHQKTEDNIRQSNFYKISKIKK